MSKKTQKWVAKNGGRVGAISARPIEWDAEGRPVKFAIWGADRPEPPGNPVKFGVETLRQLWRCEDECPDEGD